PPGPETLKKKQKNFAELKIKYLRKKFAQKMLQQARQNLIYETAKHNHKEYRQIYRNEIQMARMAGKAGNFYVPVEPKWASVIRVRVISGVSPEDQKLLWLISICQIFNSTFVKLNKVSNNMLRIVEPYIAWGYPNLKSVNELICKCCYDQINMKQIWHEDLIHEILTLEKCFKETNNFLWPFKLSFLGDGMKKKIMCFLEGGDAGNRDKLINRLIRGMN
ncbi:hypothetical protein M91_16286, partial [Bos mutus]